MILQSLVEYYEALHRKGKTASPEWCRAKAAYALELSERGELLRVLPLRRQVQRGNKQVEEDQLLEVPRMVTRSSGKASNFLCDNSTYLLGVDKKGKPERALECFQCAREKHLMILKEVCGKAAAAVRNYFDAWCPEDASEHPALAEYLEDIMAGANLVFWVDSGYAHEDAAIKEKWEASAREDGSEVRGTCLVTGQETVISRTHGTIKGVQGAQSSGAALVSFNAPAFESYGKEQSYNAPVGAYAAYAYTTALNYLIADREHRTVIGDTTIVCWSKNGEEAYQNIFMNLSGPSADNQEIVRGVFKNLEQGRAVAADDVMESISLDQRFYILGLAPNAARLAIRFFYQDSFGNILKHIKEHYDRMEIVRPAMDSIEFMGIWRMLQETVNKKSKDKKPVPGMAAGLYRSIISGAKYPQTLYQTVMGRIRAEQDDSDSGIHKITRGRASIIKAFLLHNGGAKKEEITMALNENSTDVAYTLGREFAVLEAIQEDANPGINATIKDRYFNSACATPAAIFPILFKLKNSHVRKFDGPGKKIYYEKLLGELQDKLMVGNNQRSACPARLSLEEQGMFILGYYHQNQKRYEKKSQEEK